MAIRGAGGLDPTHTFDPFRRRYDHATDGGKRARAEWRHYRRLCADWQRADPAGYLAAETEACNRRVAESLKALRIYVRLFRLTGDAFLYKRNGIEYEKALIRAWRRRLAGVRRKTDL